MTEIIDKMEIEKKIKELIKNAFIQSGYNDTFPYEEYIFIEAPKEISNGHYSCTSLMKIYSSIRVQIKTMVDNVDAEGYVFPNISDFGNNLILNINNNLTSDIDKVDIKNGFINFYLSKDFFISQIREILEKQNFGKTNIFENKKIMVEYTQPNPFKPFHIGHLMSNAIGESISRLVEFGGAKIIRANYQGDVGLHVAKAIWGLLEKGMPEESSSDSQKAQYIGECYSFASNLYEEDEDIKKQIDEINKKVYQKSDDKINQIYEWGRKITLDAFEEIYKILGTKFDYYFFESEMGERGVKIVRENTPQVFTESSGAIVFEAQNYDPKLHTRVFITSQNLPAYEAKEIGLTFTKFEKEPELDLSIVTTAIEQGEYMKVVQKAVSLINEEYEKKMKHITHGMMRFASGKMSSRKGNVVTGESLIRDVKDAILEKIKERDFNEEEKNKVASIVGVSALKYSILKQMLGKDTIYDFEKSISFEGDSGPYLQYSFARANKVVEKGKLENILPDTEIYEKEILELEVLLSRFPKIVERAQKEFAPHYIANYLVELSRSFNSFYGNTQILDKENENSSYRVALTFAFARVIKNGLYLLGIESPERM